MYADVALHGDGLTSLQYRDAKGDATHEIQSNISSPLQLRIEKRGDYVYMWLAARGEKLQPAGAAMRVSLQGPFYVGIGVCSHDKDAVAKAEFSNVELKSIAGHEHRRESRRCTVRWKPLISHRPTGAWCIRLRDISKRRIGLPTAPLLFLMRMDGSGGCQLPAASPKR